METWGLLISAAGVVAGFVAGVFAEPIKIHFTNRSKKKLLRKSLYSEIISNYRGLCILQVAPKLLGHPQRQELFNTIFNITCYDSAREKEAYIFYQIEESPEIESIYKNIKILKWLNYENEDAPKHLIARTLEMIEMSALEWKIDQDMLLTSGAFDARKVLMSKVALREIKILLEEQGVDWQKELPGLKSLDM